MSESKRGSERIGRAGKKKLMHEIKERPEWGVLLFESDEQKL